MALWYWSVMPNDEAEESWYDETISKALSAESDGPCPYHGGPRWQTKQTAFDEIIKPILFQKKFSGSVISDGECAGYGAERITFTDGEVTDTEEIEPDTEEYFD